MVNIEIEEINPNAIICVNDTGFSPAKLATQMTPAQQEETQEKQARYTRDGEPVYDKEIGAYH